MQLELVLPNIHLMYRVVRDLVPEKIDLYVEFRKNQADSKLLESHALMELLKRQKDVQHQMALHHLPCRAQVMLEQFHLHL